MPEDRQEIPLKISKSKSIAWGIMLSTFATATMGIAILELKSLWAHISKRRNGNEL
jgi:hypothetical protein